LKYVADNDLHVNSECHNSQMPNVQARKRVFKDDSEANFFSDLLIDAEKTSYDPDTGDNSELHFVFMYRLLPWGQTEIVGNTSKAITGIVSLEGQEENVL